MKFKNDIHNCEFISKYFDYSDYEFGKDRDSGKYWYSVQVYAIPDKSGFYRLRYQTSCEVFDFCPVFGNFQKCSDCLYHEEKRVKADIDLIKWTIEHICKADNIVNEEELHDILEHFQD